MVSSLSNIFTNPKFVEFAQNTNNAVISETCLKATGRPAAILLDKDTDSETKKYSALNEFLYQLCCLVIYITTIVPVFKKGGFKVFKKIYKDEHGFDKFKSAGQYLDYYSLAEGNKETRLAKLEEPKKIKNLTKDQIEALRGDKPKKYSTIKGSIELSSIIGSAVGFAIIAPQIGHAILNPVMKMFNRKEKTDPSVHSNKA